MKREQFLKAAIVLLVMFFIITVTVFIVNKNNHVEGDNVETSMQLNPIPYYLEIV